MAASYPWVMFRKPGREEALEATRSHPPACWMPKSTMKIRAKVIIMLWIRSVVDTARNPPSTV